MRVVHGLAMEFCAVFRRMLAAGWEAAVVALPVVQVVIHMPVKMVPTVKPWSRADEDTAVVPLRAVIPVRRALIGRSFVIAIRAFRLRADFDRYLRRRLGRRRQEQTGHNRHSRNQLPNLHTFPLVLEADRNRERLFSDSSIQQRSPSEPAKYVSEEPQVKSRPRFIKRLARAEKRTKGEAYRGVGVLFCIGYGPVDGLLPAGVVRSG